MNHPENLNRNRVLLAMSGGVDSSVAAFLLRQQGYEVIGVTMKTWARDHQAKEKSCCGVDAVDDARRIAGQLNIPYIALDMEDQFRATVIDNFQTEYLAGRTPNPCIVCNYKLKFGYLMQKADEFGAFYVATGHYGRIGFADGRYYIEKGIDKDKDQSYVLSNLTQEQLSRTLLPLWNHQKPEIREIALREGYLRVANKPDSQGICFVTDSYKDYLKQVARERLKPGPILNREGEKIGTHEGIALFTIGQRRATGISMAEKTYVTHIDSASNSVTIGPREDLRRTSFLVESVNWVGLAPQTSVFEALVKIRYHHAEARAFIKPVSDSRLEVEFFSPQDAVAPGQSAVLYQGDRVLAGGIIAQCF